MPEFALHEGGVRRARYSAYESRPAPDTGRYLSYPVRAVENTPLQYRQQLPNHADIGFTDILDHQAIRECQAQA